MGEETDPGGVNGEWLEDVGAAINREVSTDEPTADVVFDVLSRSYRRFVLYCLHQSEGAIDVPQLVDAVVEIAETSRIKASPTHDAVANRLVHTTLPRLVDARVVIHDREAGVVWPTDAIEALGPVLALAAELDFDSKPPLAENCVE